MYRHPNFTGRIVPNAELERVLNTPLKERFEAAVIQMVWEGRAEIVGPDGKVWEIGIESD